MGSNRSRKGAAQLKLDWEDGYVQGLEANRSRKGAAQLKRGPQRATGPECRATNRSRKGAAQLKRMLTTRYVAPVHLLTAPERGRHN